MRESGDRDREEVLREAVEVANQFELEERNGGCTLAVLSLRDNRAVVAHVGDDYAFRFAGRTTATPPTPTCRGNHR